MDEQKEQRLRKALRALAYLTLNMDGQPNEVQAAVGGAFSAVYWVETGESPTEGNIMADMIRRADDRIEKALRAERN